MRARRSVLACVVLAASLGVASEARADEVALVHTDPFETKPGYVQFFATALGGAGLRFNNPFRLATPLGADAESVSRTAPFVDLGLAATFGDPLGLQHGVTLRTAVALAGISQAVVTPSYLAYRRWGPWALWGRAGVPLVLSREPTWGLEGAVGTAWFVRGGVGLAAEVVGDMFYGAGTQEARVTSYPMLSGQAGVVIAYEVLP